MQDPAAMFSHMNMSMNMNMNGNPIQFPDQEHLKCPRCDSSNTKFCYYNNYNLSQPRHFCKNCRRYWTKGGVLRNIPVGGGSRKNSKRNSSSSSATPPAPVSSPAAPAGSSSSSSPPIDNPTALSMNHDRPILDLNGGNFSSFSMSAGHGPDLDGQVQGGSWNEDPVEVYRPNCWSGSNVWPDNLAMYTPESSGFQQFIDFPASSEEKC